MQRSAMLSAKDSIYGWCPASDDDEDITLSPDMRFLKIKPFSPSSSILSPLCPPLDTTSKIRPLHSQPIALATSTEPPQTSVATSSDRRKQRNRNLDPSWIPRPRNAFIIFRCEYSREHSQGSHDSQTDPDSTVKTLSKRAAEAWKKLPPSERDRYKEMADREREEHARLYPHYRFRPMKRQPSGARKISSERPQAPRVTSLERPPPSSMAHVPSVLTSAPENPPSNLEQAKISAPIPKVAAPPLPDPFPYIAEPMAKHVPDHNDPLSHFSSPDAVLSSDTSLPALVELCSPLCPSTVGSSPDTLRYNDSAFSLDLTHEDLERAQALEAYTIGLYNYDLFSPFTFPEYY